MMKNKRSLTNNYKILKQMIKEINFKGHYLEIHGEYEEEIPDQWYDNNNEPGTPGRPEAFLINKVYLDDVNVTEFIDTVILSSQNNNEPMRINSFWTELEEEILKTFH